MAELSVDDLLSGAGVQHTVKVPSHLLKPGASAGGEVVLQPLAIRDVDRVARAAKEQRVLTSILMVQQALVSPKMTVEQVGNLPAGLLEFLLQQVHSISGLGIAEDDLERAVKAPMARACFVLAREFGWTPAQCAELTVGQVLLYLEMLARDQSQEGAA